jgi:hypothetical protein
MRDRKTQEKAIAGSLNQGIGLNLSAEAIARLESL